MTIAKAKDQFTDKRDGQTYRTIELLDLTWMIDNYNYDSGEGCWGYKKSSGWFGLGGKQEVKGYGRLYNWWAANKFCPEGWRLPTYREWQQLAQHFGGYYDLSKSRDVGDPHQAYLDLIKGGRSGFDAQLGGYRSPDGDYQYLDGYGGYWSGTEFDAKQAWGLYFTKRGDRVGLSRPYKLVARSCRYVRNNTHQ